MVQTTEKEVVRYSHPMENLIHKGAWMSFLD